MSTKRDLKCEWMDVNVCNTESIGDTERPMKSQQPRADDFETAARAGPTTGSDVTFLNNHHRTWRQ